MDRAFNPRRVDQVQQALQTALASASTIESELAQGGMSRVFLAIETALGRRVVIKLLQPELEGALSPSASGVRSRSSLLCSTRT